MKTLRNLWDFAYGIILIAGFPLVTFFAIGDIVERLLAMGWVSGWRDDLVFPVLMICGVSAYVGSIVIRLRKRALPLWVLPVEALLGAAIALWFLCWIAMVSFFANAA